MRATGQLSIDTARTKVHIARMNRHQLIHAIREYADSANLAPSTVTLRAVNNSRLFDRLNSGGDCTTEIAGKLIAYMAENPVEQPKRVAQ